MQTNTHSPSRIDTKKYRYCHTHYHTHFLSYSQIISLFLIIWHTQTFFFSPSHKLSFFHIHSHTLSSSLSLSLSHTHTHLINTYTPLFSSKGKLQISCKDDDEFNNVFFNLKSNFLRWRTIWTDKVVCLT